jgi:hypothetical protein
MFLKLTKIIINTRQIRKIIIQPNKYYIHMMNPGTLIVGQSSFLSELEEIEVCREEHRVDYYRLSCFIEKIKD